jgi:tetratricopeptide (TPR) repeat protein
MNPTPLRTLFDDAVILPAARRVAYLDAHCSDPALRAKLESMLDVDADACVGVDSHPDSAILGASARTLSDTIGETDDFVWRPGERIGEWTLERHIGEGGSATVFQAWRDVAGVRQQAALKLLRRGLYSAEAQRQFRRERQALAALTHPNIGLLIDGGVTAAGIPYLVIEYVDGLPITEHAHTHQLDLRARLRLIVVVCRAVAAAHRNLIVHRDLKPGNVLVRADGTVKLLDFGIAKLLGNAALAEPTKTGYAPLTPGYAAPEQYSGGTISTATDVYALGVVLHELLLGERPHREQPTRPSSRVAALSTDPGSLPAPRSALRAALRGDLDNIVLKALAEEPGRRYAGASELADDIERHLGARPVHAHPPSRWYRTRKFVQRHRGGVVVTAALVCAMVASLAVALIQTVTARQEAARANAQASAAQHEAQRANAVRDFVEGLFTPISDGVAERKMPNVVELLERGSQRLGADTALPPAERVDLLMLFARINDRLGNTTRGRELGLAADAFARTNLPPGHAAINAALALRGIQAVRANDHAAAEGPLRDALSNARAAGRDDPNLVPLLDNLSVLLMDRGDAEGALALEREALAERIRRHGADAPETAAGYNNLGYGLVGMGRYAEAAPAYERAWAIDRLHLQADSQDVLSDLSNWGWALALDGQLRAARPKLAEADQGFRALGGKVRTIEVYNVQKLCALDAVFATPAVAAATCSRMLEATREQTGGRGVFMASALRHEALRLIGSGDLAGAHHRLDESVALLDDRPEHARGRGGALALRATLAWLQGDAAASVDFALAAEPLIAGIADSGMSLLNLHATIALACTRVARPPCADMRERLDAALALRTDDAHPRLLAARTLQARVLLVEDPRRALGVLDHAIEKSRRELDGEHPLVATAHAWRAHALAATAQCEPARAAMVVASAGAGATSTPVHPWLREALATPLARCRSD